MVTQRTQSVTAFHFQSMEKLKTITYCVSNNNNNNNGKKRKVEFTKCSAHVWWAPTVVLCDVRQMELECRKNCSHCDDVDDGSFLFRFSFAIYERNTHTYNTHIAHLCELTKWDWYCAYMTLSLSQTKCGYLFFCVSNQNGQTTIQQSSDVCIVIVGRLLANEPNNSCSIIVVKKI